MSNNARGSLHQEELQDMIYQEYVSESLPPVIERIKDLDDVFREVGATKAQIVPWPNPITKKHRAQNANAIIGAITEAYNEGEVLNWDNSNQVKYYLYFVRDRAGGGWVLNYVYVYYGGAGLGAGHYFKSEALARDAYSKFNAVWDDYLPK